MRNRFIFLALLLVSSTLTVEFIFYPEAKATDKIVTASPKTIWVPDNYTTIQEAINNASSGDTIFVRSGTYYENVVLGPSEKGELRLIGENKSTTIIDGNGTWLDGITVATDGATISGFTIQNAAEGISTGPMNGLDISNNIILRNFVGISLEHHGCLIINNIVTMNELSGINVHESSFNTIINNIVFNNSQFGITLGGAWGGPQGYIGNTLKNNNMTGNKWNFYLYGPHLASHDVDTSNTVDGKPVYYIANQKNLLIEPSTFPNVGYLGIVDSTNITVRNLSLINNAQGIFFANVTDSTIENVNVSNNRRGIAFSYSTENTVCGNTITNNDAGIYMVNSSYNVIYSNNFINNRDQVYVEPDVWGLIGKCWGNAWNNGYPSGGNYWSDYNGTDLRSGPRQSETGSDGIGDAPYIIDETNTDSYPLMNPWGSIFQFSHPETISIFQVHLEVNTYFSRRYCLMVKFYSYGGLYQENVTVWNETTPAYVNLSINVSHPLDNPLDWNERVPVEKATLVLIDENGTIVSSITTFVMTRSHLFERLPELEVLWIYEPPLRPEIFKEVIYIDGQWPYAPL